MRAILPKGWKRPVGYANAIESAPGKLLFLAGQVGWNEDEVFESEDLAPQFEQALKNILKIVEAAGGKPEHICRITAFCIDKPAYLKSRPRIGEIWRRHMGRHFPAMSMIFVADLLDRPGKIELEAIAVIPDDRR